MTASEEFRHLDYSQLMDLRNKEKHILIDVREKSELDETGSIPGAYHIPVGEIDKALNLSEDDFKTTYNFIKPSHDDQVIFSCRSGKRSLMALEKALSKGYSSKTLQGRLVGLGTTQNIPLVNLRLENWTDNYRSLTDYGPSFCV